MLHKELNRLYQKKYKYGLSKEDYYSLFETQQNKCAICGDSFDKTKAFVDHDHQSGKVRGLLCTRCNTLLGMTKDNVEILKSAIKYYFLILIIIEGMYIPVNTNVKKENIYGTLENNYY